MADVIPITPVTDNEIQHGIDDNPVGDGEKGAKLGGAGGAIAGGVAGSMLGPIGAVAGAVAGGVAGALGSGAAVAAVDRHDNDNKVSGVGDGVSLKHGAVEDRDDLDDDDTVEATI